MTIRHVCKCGHVKYQHSTNARHKPNNVYTFCRIKDCPCRRFDLDKLEPVNGRIPKRTYIYGHNRIHWISELGPDGKAF